MEEKIKELIAKYQREIVRINTLYSELQDQYNKKSSTILRDRMRHLLAYKEGVDTILVDLENIFGE